MAAERPHIRLSRYKQQADFSGAGFRFNLPMRWGDLEELPPVHECPICGRMFSEVGKKSLDRHMILCEGPIVKDEVLAPAVPPARKPPRPQKQSTLPTVASAQKKYQRRRGYDGNTNFYDRVVKGPNPPVIQSTSNNLCTFCGQNVPLEQLSRHMARCSTREGLNTRPFGYHTKLTAGITLAPVNNRLPVPDSYRGDASERGDAAERKAA